MKIKSLQLKNFKRFTDLTLQGIPENAKLVLLIGSNGSGKSSVFDAFEIINKTARLEDSDHLNIEIQRYYRKNSKKNYEVFFKTDMVEKEQYVSDNNGSTVLPNNSFYGRTSLRQLPKLTRKQLGSNIDLSNDYDKPESFIDYDERFENDLEHIFGKLLKEFFFSPDADKSEIKDDIIIPVNAALDRIFSKENGTKLQLIELIPPLEGKIAEVNFRKGTSIFHYNLLSAGEKEVFNILLNLVARKEYYDDTIYFFDEIDLHLNTQLQYNFLKEIVENWIPDNCQFWTASHSLGFIQYAKENNEAVIFDFDDFDFDEQKTLVPEPKDNSGVYEIAVSSELLPELFRDRKIVFIENEDRDYYASVNSKDYVFVKSKNRDSVFYKAKNGQFWGVVDRDFLTDDDIQIIEKQYVTLRILRLYCIENYLFHPENLDEHYKSIAQEFDKQSYIKGLIEEKNKIIQPLLIKVASIRQGYPYFKEPENDKSPFRKRFMPEQDNYTQTTVVAGYLQSDDVNEFLKSFSLKDYGKSLPERANLRPTDLSKTNWFKQQIESIIK